MLFACCDAQQPVAMAEVLVRQAVLLRSEQKSNTPALRTQLLPNERSGRGQRPQRMLQFAMLHRRHSDNQRAVRNSFGNALVFFSAREQLSSADCRARLAKGQLK